MYYIFQSNRDVILHFCVIDPIENVSLVELQSIAFCKVIVINYSLV